MFNIIPPKESHYLSEIPQQLDGKFSFAKKNGNDIYQLHEFVKCRDFLGDVVYCTKTNKNMSMYGFKVNKDRYFDEKVTTLLFNAGVITIDDLIKHVPSILHPIEEYNGWDLTKITRIDNTHALIEGDKRWQSTVWSISLYTFFIKVCGYPLKNPLDWMKEIKSSQSNESSYITATEKVLETLCKSLNIIEDGNITGYKDNNDSIVHNNSGFVGILKQVTWKEIDNLYSNKIKEILKAQNESMQSV